MAEYKAIHGTTVSNRTSDPLEGGITGGSWSSGGDVNTARIQIAGAGVLDSGLIFSGEAPPGKQAITESYNGTSWTEVADLNTARDGATGFGASNSDALCCGGEVGPPGNTNNTELWDGSSWTEVNNMNTTARYRMGAGIKSAGLAFGGLPSGTTANTESWNGTSWSEVNDLNTARRGGRGSGLQGAALCINGYPGVSNVESWNGTSWTEIAENNTARGDSGACGTPTNALMFGGEGDVVATEYFNGTSWTELNNLSAGRSTGGDSSNGTTAAATYASGKTSIAGSEEWGGVAGAGITLQNNGQVFYRSDTGDFKISLTQFGTGAWASGGNVNTARSVLPGFGQSHNAAIIVGGDAGPSGGGDSCDKVENYNGTSWTEIAEINTGNANAGAFGTTTAGLRCGGMPSTVNAHTGNTETWNGSAWTEVNNLNTAGSDFMTSCSGSQTAGLAPPRANVAPGTHSNISVTESWDGTSWTEIVDPNVNKRLRGGTGSAPQTSTMIFGGGYPRDGATEIFNGTSWTEVGDLNTVRTDVGGAGNSISIALAFGGRASPGPTVITEQWNGSSWTEVGDQSNGNTFYFAGAGVATSAIRAAGAHVTNTPSHTNVTEEWTIPESISNLTITD